MIGGDIGNSPRELQLLACLARHPFTREDGLQAAGLVDDSLNPNQLLRLCRFHRLAMHVTENLNGPNKVQLPQKIRFMLVREALLAGQKTDRQLDMMKRVLDALNGSGVDAFPIKGPVVSQRLYGDARRRILYDIDILVRPEQTFDALRSIEALGLQHKKEALQSGVKAEDISRLHKWGSNIGLLSEDGHKVLVELHWRPGRHHYEFPVPVRTIWDHRQAMVIDGYDTQSMDPVHEALFLMSHGCKHEWKRLHWLCDIAALMRKDDMDWQSLCELAVQCRLQCVLGSSVLLAHKVFGVQIPEPAQALLKEQKGLDNRVRNIIQRRYCGPAKNDNALEEACMEWRNASLFPGVSARLETIMAHLRPGPDDWNWIKLPNWASFAYYPLRIMRIVWETLRSMVKKSRYQEGPGSKGGTS